MPDDWQQVAPGDTVTFSARTWNSFLKAGRLALTAGDQFAATAAAQNRSTGIIRVHNNTGGNLDQGAVLGLNGPLFTPADSLDAFLREVTFEGVIPSNLHYGAFCITLEPAARDRVIRACISGVAAAALYLHRPGHAYANITPGDPTTLTSCGCGPVKILWCQDEGYAPYDENPYGYGYYDDLVWAYVLLGLEAGRSRACMAPTGGIPACSTDGTRPGQAICPMYDWDRYNKEWVASGISETVYNNGSGSTSSAKIILVTYHQGDPFAIVDQC